MKPVTTYIMGDLHFGHKNIAKFRPQFSSQAEHEQYIMDSWCSVVKDRDKIWLLGDAAFDYEGLTKLGSLPGTKYLVRGNHDMCSIHEYLEVFEEVYGIFKYKKRHRHSVWLSHAPIHSNELRGKLNIHGHVHDATIPDDRYINVCPEAIGYTPIRLNDLLVKK